MKKMALVAMVIGMTVSLAMCQDTVDNPAYKSWAAFKVGTAIKTQTTTVMTMGEKDMTTKTTTTTTLKELTADKAVVEMVSETDMNGTKIPGTPMKVDIAAKMAKDAASQPAGTKVTKKGEGDEEVAVGDKKYKCHWVENQTTSDQMDGTSKVWTCPDVPGGTVKMTNENTKPMKLKMTMETVEITAGK